MQAAFQKWTFGAFMIASTTPALAQLQETGSNPTSQAEAAPKATAPHIPAPKAEAEGAAVDLSIVYTFDVWHNSRGGIREGTRYLDNLDLTAKVDAEKLLGWRGATLFAYALYNNGEGMSRDLTGDFQSASNIEIDVRAGRLYEAWIEQRFAKDQASVKIGLYDLNSEFDGQQTGALFINSSQGIGPDFSQSGENGPSIFPVTSLALRGDYRFKGGWLVRAAVLDGVAGDPNHPKRFAAIELGHGDGALLVGDVERELGRYRAVIGYWRYTAQFDDILATARAGHPVRGGGNDGVYMTLERRFVPVDQQTDSGLRGWLRLGFANDHYNPLDHFFGGGLVYTGPFKRRAEDQVGIAFGWAHFGKPYRRAGALKGNPSLNFELSIEGTYRAVVNRWLTLQPDLQYIVNPGAVPGRRNALLFGLRTQVGF
jgi:porin